MQIVFGIARRVPLPNSKIVFGCDDRIRTCHTHHTQPQREYIFTRVLSADNFLQHDITSDRSYFQTAFMFDAPRPETQLPLARLVKVEIVSPYRGILINAGMGNPTVPFIQPLGIGES